MSLNRDSEGWPKYFGYNYLGPGNPYPNGASLSGADSVAQGHDSSYSDILRASDLLSDENFREKVAEADATAIDQFVQQFRNGDTFGGAIGAAGLSIKSAVERVLGRVLYPVPSLPGKYASHSRRHSWRPYSTSP